MKVKAGNVLWCLFFLIAAMQSLQAAYTLKNGRLVAVSEVATMTVQEHFEVGAQAVEACNWAEAAYQFNIIVVNFPLTPYGQEGYYYLGVSYFYLEEYDYANDAFTQYLKAQSNPRYFQETITYKYIMADRLASGARCRFFGTKKLPKWASGLTLAQTIYDEVIAAMPCHEIAAQALVSKGWLQWQMKNYRDAVEAFQLVIRRFPKHELAPECYLLIGKVYHEQCWYEFQNPDLLAFAEINLRRFQRDFPREERLCEAEEEVAAIKEIYAQGLYETGRFYERTCKPRAAIIYYRNTIHQFPETCIADLCRDRLYCLDPTYCPPVQEVQGNGNGEEILPAGSTAEDASE